MFSVRKSYYCQMFCGRGRAGNHLAEVFRDCPAGPVANTSLSSAGGVGSIHGWGVKIPCTSQPKITKQNMEPMLNKFNRDLKILKKKNKTQNPKKSSLAQRLLLNSKISFVCRSFVILHILSFLLNQMMNC